MAKLNLDLSGVKVSEGSGFSVVPSGNYDVQVVSAEVKETKTGGSMLVFGLEILDGEHKGKVIRDSANTTNQNPEAVRIGYEKIKKIALVSGHKNPDRIIDTDDFLNLNPFMVIVETTDDGEYKRCNIKSIIATTVPGKVDTSFTAPPAEKAKAPWKK
jgi:hypothetical protein